MLDGLKEGEEVVISAQFMFDSESRLKEAIQKMLEVRSGSGEKKNELSADDLEMEGMTMDDELDEIDAMKMDQ